MKLFIYEHCPYCVRARMIFGFKNIPVEIEVLPNDDELTPIHLIGKKIVPILIKDDGQSMAESMDIVHYVDALYGEKKIISNVRKEITDWLSKVGEYYERLVMPRCIKIGLEEFATQSAIDYYRQKKSMIIGDFEKNLMDSPNYIAQMCKDLVVLENLIMSTNALQGNISEEDILVFPLLRSLTMVRDMQWMENIKDYVESMSMQTHIPLFFDRAI